jgi:NADP-dependent 3-hydroxy acid dehydrogenase YdfG
MGLAIARLATDVGAEVTIAGRSQDKLLQAQQELGQVHLVVMDITDEGAAEKGFAGLSRVDHVLI